MLFVLGHAVADLAGMTEGGAVDLAGPDLEQVAEHQADGPADAGARPVARPDGVEPGVHADLATDRPVHDDEDAAPPGAGRCAVQQEGLGEHRRHRRHDHGEVLREASGHHRVDRHLLGGDGPLSHGLDADQVVGAEQRPIEAIAHRAGGRRDDRQTVGPTVGVEVLLERGVVIEDDSLGPVTRRLDHCPRCSESPPGLERRAPFMLDEHEERA